jgi:hypothetical protein
MEKREKTTERTAEEKAEERMTTLQKYVSDMMAVEEHIGSAVKRQVKDDNLAKHTSRASEIINRIAETTERHEQDLKHHLETIGGDAAKGIKEVATAALGTLAGLYDKIRTEAISKMLRDDYTALNLAAVGYTMLYTTGLALNDQATAALALRHLQDYTTIIMEINVLIPNVVVTDLRDNGAVIAEGVLQQAIDNTQAAWQPSHGAPASSNGHGTGISMTPATSKPAANKPRTAKSKPATMTENVASTSKPRTTTKKKSTADDGVTTSSKPRATTKRAPAASKAKSSAPST